MGVAAISKKCVGVAEYFVTRYLAKETARLAAFLAEQTEVLGCGAVVQHTSRAVVTAFGIFVNRILQIMLFLKGF